MYIKIDDDIVCQIFTLQLLLSAKLMILRFT